MTAVLSVPAAVRRPSHTSVAVAILTAVALAIRIYRLARPGFLFGAPNFDDGVYFGNAVELVHGRLPYRDFVAVEPPLIVVLMSPLAALSSVFGTANGLAIARVLTAVVGAAQVPLLARLLRGRSTPAVLVACAVVTTYPGAVRSSGFLLLEPWLTLFCLLGALVVFRDGRLRFGLPLFWGGVLFGLGGAVKVWAIAPVVVLAVLLIRRGRELGRFSAGVAAGFLVPTLPFAAAAPTAFIKQVILAQAVREGPYNSPTMRLAYLFGLNYGSANDAPATPVVAVVAVLVTAGIVASWVLRWRRHSLQPLELFAVGSTVAITAMFLAAQQFYYHYGGFLAPWLALAVALPIDGAASAPQTGGRWFRVWTALMSLAAVAMAGGTLVGISSDPTPVTPAAQIARVIPKGACVLTNHAALLLEADRFGSGEDHCPALVDGYGTALVVTHGEEFQQAQHNPALRRHWIQAARRADYVVWSPNYRRMAPIGYVTGRYLRRHFVRVEVAPRTLQIYRRITGAASVKRS